MVLLPRLTKQIMRRCNPHRLGLDLRLLMALSYLRDHDGAPQHELADTLCMDAKNVVLLLNEFEESGHWYAAAIRDRRRHRVYITDSGRQALDRADGALLDIEADVLQALDADERATLRNSSPGPSATLSRPSTPTQRWRQPGLGRASALS